MALTVDRIRDSVRYDPESRMFSIIDTIMLVKDCNRHAAKMTLQRLVTDEFLDGTSLHRIDFPGRGREAPACTFSVLCEIIALLPGPTANEFRRQAMHTFARALGGDLSLATDIQNRAARLAGTELQEALLEGTQVDGHIYPAVLNMLNNDVNRKIQRTLLDLALPNPRFLQNETATPLDLGEFVETVFVKDPTGYVPLDLFESLVRYEELYRLREKECLINNFVLKGLCLRYDVKITKKARRSWDGAFTTRDWIDGLRLADHQKSLADAKTLVYLQEELAAAVKRNRLGIPGGAR